MATGLWGYILVAALSHSIKKCFGVVGFSAVTPLTGKYFQSYGGCLI